MKKFVLLVFLVSASLFYLWAKSPDENRDYQSAYREAIAIFLSENTNDQLDSLAIAKFQFVISVLEKTSINDSVLIDTYQKQGSLYIGFDQQAAANANFNKIIACKEIKKVPEPVLFAAYLYSGRTYYSLSNFDSAYIRYKKAEEILDKLPANAVPPEAERLYNMLGVLFYDYGNYKDAINYFSKAVQLLAVSGKNLTENQDLYQNYKLNIISCYIKLHLYKEANQECMALQKNGSVNAILENALQYKRAEIGLGLKEYTTALSSLRKVQYYDRNLLKVYNAYANIFIGLAKYDSASVYIQKAIQTNAGFYKTADNFDMAVSYMHWGNILAKQKKYSESLVKYQIAISKLQLDFKDSSIFSNPQIFKGTFSASTLLDCLIAKASVFYQWYGATKNLRELRTSLETYNAVFTLAGYMENSYTSDEAVLFLGEKKLAIHDAPIRICLQLYQLTGEARYFESALLFDEQNKNTVLNKANGERQLVFESRIPADLLEKERKVKNTITLLSLKASGLSDTVALQPVRIKINDAEIELAKIKEKKRSFEPSVYKESKGIKLAEIQKKLAPGNCILSYHVMDTGIVGFLISRNNFFYKNISIDTTFFTKLHAFAGYVKEAVPETDPDLVNRFLYDKLIAPFKDFLREMQTITILPDDDLHLLPFEVLKNEQEDLLTNQFAINYCTSYRNMFLPDHFNLAQKKILAFAPFSLSGNHGYKQLSASGNEVADMKGTVVLDSLATKTSFLNQIKKYPILHLATHAKVNDSFPEISHIIFYNKGPVSDTGLLYSKEIANLDLSATKLVYLSACETGTGKLIKGEGLMSLSRSFSYAGCSNIITSLWQADDASTAYITNKFYAYLDKKYQPGKALQLAKLDYLKDPAIEKRKKTPYYWAHMIYIGQIKAYSGSWLYTLLYVFLGIIIVWLGVILYKKKGVRKNSR